MRPALRYGLVAIIIALIGSALVFLRGSRPQTQADGAASAAAPASTKPAAPATGSAPTYGAPRATTSSAPIEVCGYGKTLDPDAPDFWNQVRSIAERTAAVDAAIVELGASSDPVDRAVALWFKTVETLTRVQDAAMAGSRDCERNDACRSAAGEAAAQAAAPYTQQLIELALRGTDPVVYSLAYATCLRKAGPRPASCAQIGATRWAEIDPQNGAAWLFVATEAAARNDDAARAHAIARAAASERFDQYGAALLRPTATRALRDAQPLDKLGAVTEVTGVYAAWPESSYSEAAAFCEAGSPAALEPRGALCDALANRLLERDATTMGLTFGRRIGERLGWSPERLAALKDERDAIAWVEARDTLPFRDFYSCAALEKAVARNARILKYGELGALRREVVNSGRTPAELARALREDRARRQASPQPPMPQ